MDAASKTQLLRIIAFFIYIFAGGAIFMKIEEDDNEEKTLTLKDLKTEWAQKYNLSYEAITKLLQEYDNAKADENKPRWSFGNSVFFVFQLATTIGYGNITPTTSFGQIFTMTYATIGIPITILALKSIGELVNNFLKVITRPLHRKFHCSNCNERMCNFMEKEGICANLVLLVLVWFFACVANALVQRDIKLVSNVYSIFISYATVGFGDFIPFQNQKHALILCILPGLSFMSSFIDSVVSYVDKNKALSRPCLSLPKGGTEEEAAKGSRDNVGLDEVAA